MIDFPSDRGCVDANDTSEQSASLPCDDGVDNDHDAKKDFRLDGLGDPGCFSTVWFSESPKCSDHVDNDGDGLVDWDGHFGLHAPDPDCFGAAFWIAEVPEPGVLLGLITGIAWLGTIGRRRMKP